MALLAAEARSQQAPPSGDVDVGAFVPNQAPPTPGSGIPERTAELLGLLARAARLNRHYEADFDASFSSMLLAFLVSDDWVSRWFQRYVREAGVAVDALLAQRKLDRATLEQEAAEGVSLQEMETRWRQTSSATSLLDAARRIRDQTSSPGALTPLDVIHLMAAYVYDPAGHQRDLEQLKFDPPAWSLGLLNQIARRFPAEAGRWKAIHRRTFPQQEIPLLDNEGPSTHVARDRWTVDDTLGYKAYAYAIYRFMTHPQTQPPLAISIQAPWGGGKTSLMRMIQNRLDPDAVELAEHAPGEPKRRMTVGKAMQEIDKWIRQQAEPLPAIDPPAGDEERRFSIWFNAWKYESGTQIWAGLADAIMRQVAARLRADQRELFWLRLNLKRLDPDAVRRRVYDRVFGAAWRLARGWLGLAAAGLAASASVAFAGLHAVGWVGAGLSTIGGIVVGLLKYGKAEHDATEEAADVTLGAFLSVPDYRAELGFVHHVDADLRRVLDTVPGSMKPLVIFVDDLDRCSPTKVAEVVEGVNLFLAGELPSCLFVLGMDAEMVAAALQAHHREMCAALPPDAAIPVGWRFMDKFVQLPFVIPPAEPNDLTAYATALTTPPPSREEVQRVARLAQEAADRIHTRTAAHDELLRVQQEQRLGPAEVEALKHRLVSRGVERELGERIEAYSDDNPEVKDLVATATASFSGNPRDIKRFVNTFRFHYFLWAAHEARSGQAGVTLEQLQRWVVFSMRWPEVVRWVRRAGGREWRRPSGNDQVAPPNRLSLLEAMGHAAEDLPSWQAKARELLRLDADQTPWLNDDDLLEFFHREGCSQEGKRLSDGAGKGLW